MKTYEVDFLSTKQIEKQTIGTKLLLVSLFMYLSFGRWGAQIQILNSPIYIFDLAFMVSILLGALRSIMRTHDRINTISSIRLITICIVVMTLSQILVSMNQGNDLTKVIRDSLPFLVLLTFPILGKMTSTLNFTQILKVLRVSTLIHSVWYALQVAGIIQPLNLNFAGLSMTLFSSRNDWSCVTLAIGVLAWGRHFDHLKRNLFVVSWFTFIGAVQLSRAGTLAIIIALIFIISGRKKIIFSFFSLCLFILMLNYTIPFDATGNSGLNRISNIFNDQGLSPDGTARARLEAWKITLASNSTPASILFGQGPGTEVLLTNGAFKYLSGNEEVRSPHNFFITLFMRFGVIGLVLWSFLTVSTLIKSVGSKTSIQLFRQIVFIIFIPSLFGVILENMFALVPYFICLAFLDSSIKRQM